MKKENNAIHFRVDNRIKRKLNLIAQDKNIKPSVLYRRILEDYIRLYEERGY